MASGLSLCAAKASVSAIHLPRNAELPNEKPGNFETMKQRNIGIIYNWIKSKGIDPHFFGVFFTGPFLKLQSLTVFAVF
jgi:hypothetical protein